MPGKRPRPIMRRTSSVSLIGTGGSFMISDCSPLPEPRKEKQKGSSSPAAIPPRQVIGFHPKSFIHEEEPPSALHVLPPTSPRLPPQQQVKSPGTGSPRSVLGDLFVGSRPWDKRDEGVGLGFVATLGGVQCLPEEDLATNKIPPPPPLAAASYTRKMSPQHLPSVFAPTNNNNKSASPPIPIVSPRSVSHNCAPQFGLSTAMQESLMHQQQQDHHRAVVPTPGRAAGGISMLSTWSQQADHMEVTAAMSMALSPVGPKAPPTPPPYLPALSSGLNFLDACFYCKRRLGEGRDIYMYRGDKAFCSPECRHQQITMDERPEKCSQTAMKVRGGADAARHHHGSQRNGVVAAGTAAAA
ncbi:hypothetical protein R1flu_021618 [Riccia fluitans]|uniref:FLZ-type domain-containing protein n=1 Tax=Riccia fluitans TaxID=41844 RepID=A0ABD1ZPX0_9MARC